MISLYRGELHKVSDVPRQWTVPKSQIPLAVFKSALKKRNAALHKFLEASAADAGAAPVANGPGKPSEDHVSGSSSGEPESRGGEAKADDYRVDGRAENGAGSSDGNQGDGKGAGERRQERKRRREEDCREDTGICFYAKGGFATAEDVVRESTSRGKAKVTDDPGPEPMAVDDADHFVAMDCDGGPLEKTAMDCDESTAERVRVRVNDTQACSERENTRASSEVAIRDARHTKGKDGGNPRRNGELLQMEATGLAFSNFEENKSGQIQVPATENGTGEGSADIPMTEEDVKKREELEAKLEKLRAEKHRFVLRLKQVLNEEEMKKRGSLASGSPFSQGHLPGMHDSAGLSIPRGFLRASDLEDGELDYARTPSPPTRGITAFHGSHSTLGPTPPLAPVIGRQTSLSHHLSQSAPGRGGYYVAGPPSQATSGIASGPISPRAGFMGNVPSSVGSHSYSHSMALQHAAIHAQKVSSAAHGHSQFSPMPPSGAAPGSSGHGVGGGPPGFSGYAVSSSVHSHHSHLSQPASSSISHLAGGQVVSSSSLLTTPRGPPGYHDIRMGGSTWVQR